MKRKISFSTDGDSAYGRSLLATILRVFPIVAAIAVAVSLAHIYARTVFVASSYYLDVAAFICYGCLLYVGLLRPTLVRLATTRLAPAINGFLGTVSGHPLSLDSTNIARGIAFAIIGIGVLIAYLLSIDYLGHEQFTPGTFGDFFGGVLNPLLTFLTFVALAITMAMQRAQLRTALDDSASAAYQAALQRFETTFFNLLDLHNAIVRDLHLVPSEITLEHEEPDYDERVDGKGKPSQSWSVSASKPAEVTGRRVFAAVLRVMEEKVHATNPYGILVTPVRVYSVVQDEYNYVLGHYFRNLFQILSLIDMYAVRFAGKNLQTPFEPKRFSNLLRAQLSTNELALLMFNCLKGVVDGGRFLELVVTYEMLEHMSVECDRHYISVATSGYKLDIRNAVVQYFERGNVSEDGGQQYSSGAFGTNPKMLKYVAQLNFRLRSSDDLPG